LTEKDLLRVHGNNERVALENLRFGTRMMLDIIKEIAV
jgi:acetylornithine deacetylase/succinyl-diaminopimelate desuccinylase-like protein